MLLEHFFYVTLTNWKVWPAPNLPGLGSPLIECTFCFLAYAVQVNKYLSSEKEKVRAN